jgi:hypothetical protein
MVQTKGFLANEGRQQRLAQNMQGNYHQFVQTEMTCENNLA